MARDGSDRQLVRNYAEFGIVGLPDVSGFPNLMFLKAFRRPVLCKNPLRWVLLIEMHFRMATLGRSPQKYAEELGKSNIN